DELDPFTAQGSDKALAKSLGEAAVGRSPHAGNDDDALVSQPPKILPKSRLAANVGTLRLENSPRDPTGIGARLLQVPAVVNRGREKSQLILADPETRPTTTS